MNKRICSIITAILLCCFAKGAVADNRIDWGMRIAIDADLPGKWKGEHIKLTMFKPGIGMSIGAVAKLNLGNNFYFEPHLSLFYSGYRYKDLLLTGPDGEVKEKDPKLDKWGLQIPLLAGYHIPISDRFSLEVFTGPQMRYAFAGNIRIKNKALKEYLGNSLDLWGDNGQRRFDLSWKIGIGVPINNSAISLETDLGLTDLQKGNITFRENRVNIGFTKFF